MLRAFVPEAAHLFCNISTVQYCLVYLEVRKRSKKKRVRMKKLTILKEGAIIHVTYKSPIRSFQF